MTNTPISDTTKIKEFMFAGNATFTIRSVKSGTRFTYKLKKKKDNADILYLHLLYAPDAYKFTGTVVKEMFDKRSIYYHSKASKINRNAESMIAFNWFLEHVQRYSTLTHAVEFWHEGKCGRCGRPLTVPSSIATGLGPDCAAIRGVNVYELLKNSA